MSTQSTRPESDNNSNKGSHQQEWSDSDLLRDLERLEHCVSARLEVDDDALAALVVLRGIRPTDRQVAALMKTCRADASLRTRIDVISQRGHHLVLANTPSKEHFEQLRAHSLRIDRGPLKGSRTWGVRSVIVGAVLLVLFVGIFYLGTERRPVHQQLAALETLTSSVPELHFRSTTASAGELHGYYLVAVQDVLDAEKSVLGLFRRFDSEKLRQAREQFIALTVLDPEGAIGLEAAYARARIDLYDGDTVSAREWLTYVVNHQGPSMPEASELLERLEQHAE